jgi:Kdo2-lipid IVA lauroyltransferase/acyltransferase
VSQSEPNPQNPVRDTRVGGSTPSKPSVWIRLFSRIPLSLWYPFARFLAWMAWRVIPYRRHVVEGNLKASFPDWDAQKRELVIRDYYRGFADMFVEVLRSARFTEEQLARHVKLVNPELVREEVTRSGKPVLLMAAHQGNWEWLLLGLSTQLGVPVEAAYKPLVDNWAERDMLYLRGRFGARMVAAPQLLADIIQQRHRPRGIAIVADQEPVTSERKHWLKFLNRDSAFFVGAEEIARAVRYAAFFVKFRRVSRGCYEAEFAPLAAAGEKLEPGEFTGRYARMVEEQIHAAPADWPWSHKRWKLKKPLYQG